MSLPSVDPFLRRRRRPGYDCRHFADEVWRALTGEDIPDRDVRAFERLAAPVEPCLVLFRRRSGIENESHVGVYLRGKVLHLGELGARHERLDIVGIGFSEVRFYR